MKFKDWSEKKELEEAMGFVQKLDYQKGKGPQTSPPKKQSMVVNAKKDINKAVEMFVKGAQKKIDDHYKKDLPNSEPDILKIQKGKRYIKVVQTRRGQKGGSVWAFVDAQEGNTFGDILKPASWKAPAKHARGNVFDGSWGVNSVGVYGPAYLR